MTNSILQWDELKLNTQNQQSIKKNHKSIKWSITPELSIQKSNQINSLPITYIRTISK